MQAIRRLKLEPLEGAIDSAFDGGMSLGLPGSEALPETLQRLSMGMPNGYSVQSHVFVVAVSIMCSVQSSLT